MEPQHLQNHAQYVNTSSSKQESNMLNGLCEQETTMAQQQWACFFEQLKNISSGEDVILENV